ncbi:TolB protein-related isoform 2, partial [Theobroma cacao]
MLRHLIRKQPTTFDFLCHPLYFWSHLIFKSKEPRHSHGYIPTPTHPTPSSMNPKGTVVFTSVGRPQYGFDIFTVNLNQTPITNSTPEHRLTDCISINFNAQFINEDQSIVFISERSGSPRIYLTHPDLPKPEQLTSAPSSLFHDRPIIQNHRLYFISAHEQPDQPFKSWSALYSTELRGKRDTTRLSPYGVADYSPAISKSGKFVAVASYGSRPWEGDFHELKTDIVVFPVSNPNNRFVVCEKGGWPTWSGDSTIFFHRQADDGWWSIFRLEFPENPIEFSGFPVLPLRVTPPGLHCFTAAAFHDGKRIAVATRRRGKNYRHIEVFDLESKVFHQVTELLNPSFHHYNPFVSLNSEFLGYHRFRGESTQGESTVPHLEPVMSPLKNLRMLRLNGSFPSFSPDGDLLALNPTLDESGGIKVVKSNGSKRWTLIKGRTAFYNSWSPTEKHVIYTSLGPIFESVKTTVQVARITDGPWIDTMPS